MKRKFDSCRAAGAVQNGCFGCWAYSIHPKALTAIIFLAKFKKQRLVYTRFGGFHNAGEDGCNPV